jgi:hypothetical protein
MILSVPVCVQMVLPEGVPKVTIALVAPVVAVIEISAGQVMETVLPGGLTVLPTTVTLKQQEAVAPHASVAKKQTCVVPTGKLDPLENPVVCAKFNAPGVVHVVEAVGAKYVTIALVAPVVAVTVTLAGQVMVTMAGGGGGFMVIRDVAVLVLPQASVAVQVRVMVDTAGHGPPVVTSANVIATTVQLSLTVGAVNVAVAGQVMVVLAGTFVRVGAVTSLTLMVCDAEVELLQASVAVQVRIKRAQPPS